MSISATRRLLPCWAAEQGAHRHPAEMRIISLIPHLLIGALQCSIRHGPGPERQPDGIDGPIEVPTSRSGRMPLRAAPAWRPLAGPARAATAQYDRQTGLIVRPAFPYRWTCDVGLFDRRSGSLFSGNYTPG